MQAVSPIIYMYTYKFKVDFVLQLINIQTPVMHMAGKHKFHCHYPRFGVKHTSDLNKMESIHYHKPAIWKLFML